MACISHAGASLGLVFPHAPIFRVFLPMRALIASICFLESVRLSSGFSSSRPLFAPMVASFSMSIAVDISAWVFVVGLSSVLCRFGVGWGWGLLVSVRASSKFFWHSFHNRFRWSWSSGNQFCTLLWRFPELSIPGLMGIGWIRGQTLDSSRVWALLLFRVVGGSARGFRGLRAVRGGFC